AALCIITPIPPMLPAIDPHNTGSDFAILVPPIHFLILILKAIMLLITLSYRFIITYLRMKFNMLSKINEIIEKNYLIAFERSFKLFRLNAIIAKQNLTVYNY
ncbi:MAG TPA: hypothetical protein VEF53_01785, partial [Patescibacteria group bacterium]|nr:hypothetical protein [Patescibacteria group bacterium]